MPLYTQFCAVRKLFKAHPLIRLFIILSIAMMLLMYAMYLFEDMSIWHSFYFSIVTGTTVGYGDFSPKTVQGQVSVILFALTAITSLGEFITMTVSASTDMLHRSRKGLHKVTKSPELLIIGYPNASKVQSIVTEYRNDDIKKFAAIVCITDKLDEQPEWMIDLDVLFVKGLASSKDVLERANVRNAKKAIVLANDAEQIASDDFTTSAVLMCETLNSNIYTIAERVRQETYLFDMCKCDHVVEVTTGRLLAQEALNPGAIALMSNLLSSVTPATQRNVTLSVEMQWHLIITPTIRNASTCPNFGSTTTHIHA